MSCGIAIQGKRERDVLPPWKLQDTSVTPGGLRMKEECGRSAVPEEMRSLPFQYFPPPPASPGRTEELLKHMDLWCSSPLGRESFW